ncbi:2-hydroxyacid dehydrogenase [Virgibacillus doumboii]|uniref:2-hydroxyacid dehydrogenase n=1 Tax=Virgibacillus doumboii TaxID=2697503 RepID=UPI0013DEE9AC|nr:D-glycerate dehydrogenase [Virgibacillus doumboii]
MGKPVIYITRKIPDDILQPYQDSFNFRMWAGVDVPVPRDVLLREAASADGILCLLTEKVNREVFAAANNLKIVANMAVGYDNIDVDAAREHNVVVTNTPDVLTETTADLTFALLMAAARRIVEAEKYISDDRWKHWSPYLLAGSDVHGKKIGIVGMGRIGEAVARRAKGFGMTILYHNRSRKNQTEQELGVFYTEFEELLNKADYVVSLVPMTDETKKMFDRKAFQKMKSTAIFINVSRGGVVDEGALHDALTENEIRGAGLDVFENEPIAADHPLLQMQNVVCLPHIGSASIETRTKMLKLCLDNLAAVFDGDDPITPVT